MARKKGQAEPEQMDLIDVKPENAKEILGAARKYKKAQKERIGASAVEVQEKQKVLNFIKKANLKPLDDGTIKFVLDGVKICVKPRDELLTVKCEDEED